MKKFLFITIICILLTFTLYGGERKIGFYMGFNHISDSAFKEIYGNGGLIFGANFSYEILNRIDIWTSIKRFSKTGETTVLKEKVDFKIIPISIGAKYKIEVDEGLETYFGGGGDLYFYNEKGVDFNTKDSELGFHLQGGVLAKISKRLQLDFNFKFTRVKSKPEENLEINLGGVEGGISLVFLF
jgi:hypothetical protein